MIIMLKNTGGQYRPLDVFEDFSIFYNHQYEDYKGVGGKLMPYTNKFKIPTTPNNRDLCGLPFDLAYPTRTSIEGQCLYSDGTLAFEFIADIEGQTVNVLQPYISLTIIDKISKAISELSKWKMSDMMSGNTFNFATDTWMYGDQSGLTDPEKYFLFAYHNYNNKNALFSHDPMRELSQLHPSFVLNKLVDKMFDYVGLTVESDFLNLDGQLASGINANQLALTIPARLKTLSNYQVVADHNFGWDGTELYYGYTDRVVGIPSQMPTTNRLTIPNFLPSTHEALKMNYDLYADSLWQGSGALGADPYKAKYCSMVTGNLKIKVEGYDNAIKPLVKFGAMFGTDAGLNNKAFVTSVTTANPPDLDVMIVNADTMERVANGSYWTYTYWEQATSYDIKNGHKVGKAVYQGLDGVNGVFSYEIQIDPLAYADFDVEANQELNLCYVLVPPNGDSEYVVDYHMTDTYEGGDYTMQMIIKEGYLEYRIISDVGGTRPYSYYETQSVTFTRPDGINEMCAKLTFSFDEYTDIPCGYVTDGGFVTWAVPNVEVDMGESIKAVRDYSLMEILQLIMERFNLQMYTTSDGVIHIDTEENRRSGVILNIDHLIDESMEASFVINQNGILNVKDTNASFYGEDFNRLDKYKISEDKRDEITLSFKSGIVNDKMFEDKYDNASYEILKYGYDSNYWGTADRAQVKPEALKPTFSILETSTTPLYVPTSKIQFSSVAGCPTDENHPDYDPDCLDFFTQGFYNSFYHNTNTGKIDLQLKASNVSANGFSMISFEDDKFLAGDNNLFKKTWYQNIMSRLHDDSVLVDFEIYSSEDTFSILKDFPTIRYKGQDWDLKGVTDFPLSAQDGGITKITLIKSAVWS